MRVETVDARLESALEQAGIPYQKRLQQAGTSVGYRVAGALGVRVRGPCSFRHQITIIDGYREIDIKCSRRESSTADRDNFPDGIYDEIVERAVEQIKTSIRSLMAMTL